jgi:hypothetical protein
LLTPAAIKNRVEKVERKSKAQNVAYDERLCMQQIFAYEKEGEEEKDFEAAIIYDMCICGSIFLLMQGKLF